MHRKMSWIWTQFLFAWLGLMLTQKGLDALKLKRTADAKRHEVLPFWDPDSKPSTDATTTTTNASMQAPDARRKSHKKNFRFEPIETIKETSIYRKRPHKTKPSEPNILSWEHERDQTINTTISTRVPKGKSRNKKKWIEPVEITKETSVYISRTRKTKPTLSWSHEEVIGVVSPVSVNNKIEPTTSSKDYVPPNGENKTVKLRAEEPEPEIRSTRIAPLYLMQQEEDTTTTTTKPPTGAQIVQEKETEKPSKGLKDSVESDDPFVLNPYAIEKQISKILSELNDVSFETEVLGRTAAFIDIVLFKLVSKKGGKYFRANDDNKYIENETKEKKILFIVHALSPMGLAHFYSLTVENYLERLLGYYAEHLDKFDIYLIPMANPDGYIRVKQYSAYWNKNYAPNSACPGVHVDRNFDVAWNSTNEQLSSCDHHYPGATPFSEPESRAVRDVLHRMSHKIVAYFHVHAGSYIYNIFKGDAVLYPKGYTDVQSDDDKYIDLKGEIDEAMKNANFKVMSVTVDTLYNWYGKISGSSVDYAATVYGIPYAMEFAMQLYHDAYQLPFKKMTSLGAYVETLEDHALEQIWKRIIDIIFTNIYKKLEANDAARKR